MPSIAIGSFGATVPKQNAKLLKENQAQTASNTDLSRGAITGRLGFTTVSTLAGVVPKTLWRVGTTWKTLGNAVIADVCDSWVQESNNRFFYTGDSYPKQSDSSLHPSTWRLGVTAPTSAPNIALTGTGDGTVAATISYYYTMVTAWGEESAPSPETAVIDVETGQGILLTAMDSPGSSGNSYQYKNIYRLAAGTTGAEYSFLAQIAAADTTYSDFDTDHLREVTTDTCETEGWVKPPDALTKLTMAHNGMLLGAVGKELYVSEPFIPYAFPTVYKKPVDSDITGIGATREFILVLSSNYPYVINGATPEGLVVTQIKRETKCLSQRGIASTDKGIYFPSSEGLCFCNGSDITCVTVNTYTTTQWAALTPSNFIAKWYRGKYVAFVEGAANGISIDTDTGEVETFAIPATITSIRDVFHLSSDDNLYILGADGGGTNSYIMSMDTNATALTFTWKSKKFTEPERFTCAKIKGVFTSGSLTFTYYLNGSLKLTKTVSSEAMFMLPPDPGSTDKELQVSGTIPGVDSIQISTDPSELV